ncbi:MAG: methionine--tRNA ligase [Candidatus Glassbacteria bacterium]
MDNRKVLVTSALPYANGPIHLGHLAGAYLPADIFVRFCRMMGRNVLYVGGTDEHGVPITITADRQGITPQQVVDKWYPHIRDTFSRAGISFDHFSRTSLPIHHQTSQDWFLKIHEKGLLTRRTEKQLYDAKLGRFLPDRYVEGTCYHCGYAQCSGDQCESCGKPIDPLLLVNPRSKLSDSVPVVKETEHLYLSLDKLQAPLAEWLAGKEHWKENVIGFCKGMLAEGLKERAVTRDLHWGIPVPLKGFEGKVLYVWFDAVIGYVSSTREWAALQGDPELWKEWWWNPEVRLVHFIGKDNIFFHALMFPAMMMAYGHYVLPDNVPANEYLNLEGLKFSTSRNFAVWLHDYLDRFHPDPLRYYLCASMPETRDTDFNLREFQAHNNNELADTVGNFINRTLTFVQRYYDGRIPERGKPGTLDSEMLSRLGRVADEVGDHIDHFRYRLAADTFGEFARFCNKYFNDKAPWETRKSDPENCATTLNICSQAVYGLSVVMFPIMPFSAENVWGQLGLSTVWKDHPWQQDFSSKLPAGHAIGKVAVLFPKIDDAAIEAQEASYKGGKTQEKKAETAPTIQYDDFIKVDVRVAVVTAAEEIAKSNKLLKLTLDLGPLGTRTVAAGIRGHYTPESLVGRKVLVCANLAPRKVMGIESQGMVLAAVHGEGDKETLALTTIDPAVDLPPGTRIS